MMRPGDEDIILKAQRRLAEAETMRAELEFKADGDWAHPALPIADGEVALHGRQTTDIDRSRPGDRASATRFEYGLENGGASLRLKGESRLAEGMHYLRLENASETLFTGIGRLTGKWVRTDIPFLTLMGPPVKPGDDNSEGGDAGALDAAAVAELEGAFSSIAIFEAAERLEDVRSNGESFYRFRVTLDRAAVTALLLRRRELLTGVTAEPEDLARMEAGVESWGMPEGEVLIDKKTHRFRRIELKTMLPEAYGGAGIEATLLFSRYGEPVAVEIPDAEDLEDILGRTLLARLRLAGDRPPNEGAPEEEDALSDDEAPPENIDTELDIDDDGLPNELEFFYGSDPWNPDTDADGWQDGREVESGMNPVGPGPLFGFGL